MAQPAVKQMALVPAEDAAMVPPAPVDQGAGLALVIQRLAENPSVDVDKLERIILLQERILQHQAKASFDAAFAAMQAELPVIVERGRTDKAKYATLEDIVETVRPILARHGFSLSHRTEWPQGGMVQIIGILAHRAGHEKTSTFISLADKSGSKNDIQALGSACSYGRRYTTLDLLNIVTRGQDDDGRGSAGKVPEPPKGFEEWADNMAAVVDEGYAKLEATWKASKPEFRDYTQRQRPALLASWKTKARAVDQGANRG